MKVLLLDVNCKYSSTGKMVYDLFSFVNKSGDEATVCYGRGDVIDEDGIYKFGIDFETKIHAFLTRVTGLTGVFSYFSTKRLIDFIADYKPDVIHIHELHAYFVNIGQLFKYLKKNNINIVWTFHCEFMYTGKCGVSYECEKFITGCGNCPHLRAYPKTLFFDFTRFMWKQKYKLFKNYSRIQLVTPSVWLANRTKRSFLKNYDIKIINNGIDTDIFHPCSTKIEIKTRYNIKEEKIVISVASHITTDTNKGARYIYELAKRVEGKNIHFILVGSDEQKVVKKNNITILPVIKNQRELAKLYSGSDVFLICSEKENYPTTSLEAQCCGTPVCGFDVGGVKETVIIDSFLCEYGNVDRLEDKLLQALDISFDANKAIEKYSKENMLNTYYNLYKIWYERK